MGRRERGDPHLAELHLSQRRHAWSRSASPTRSTSSRSPQAIHAIDPNHPVTSTDAWTGAWPYYKQYTPSLDLLAVNSYGSVCNVNTDWVNGGYTKPYIVTEAGDRRRMGGSQRRQRRAHRAHRPAAARRLHQRLELHRGPPRHLLRRDPVQLRRRERLRRRLVQPAHRRLAPAVLLRGQAGLHRPGADQHAAGDHLDDAQQHRQRPGGRAVHRERRVDQPDRRRVELQRRLVEQVRQQHHTAAVAVQLHPDRSRRLHRHRAARRSACGKCTCTSTTSTAAWASSPRRSAWSRRRSPARTWHWASRPRPRPSRPPATARPSSAGNATDGNWTTRWASDWSDPQWIQVDLGQSTAIKHIQLGWESAYAQGVPDPGVQRRHELDHRPQHHDRRRRSRDLRRLRHRPLRPDVRHARGTAYGYSLYEFGIYA